MPQLGRANGIPDGIAEEVARLREIPLGLRAYTSTPRDAERHFGIEAPTLRALMAAGLPHRGDSGDLLFDSGDLKYLGIRIGTARAHLASFAFMARSLERFACQGPVPLTVRYIPRLPAGVERVAGTVAMPDGGRREVELIHNEGAVDVSLVVTTGRRAAPSVLADAIRQLTPLDLYSLPGPLVGDIAFVRRTGLSECVTAAHMVADCCNGLDYPARVASGLLISIPWAHPHFWCEVQVDDEWLPIDPLMLRALQAFGGLDARVWPIHRPFTPVLARFPEGSLPLVASQGDGKRIEATFLTAAELSGSAPTRLGVRTAPVDA